MLSGLDENSQNYEHPSPLHLYDKTFLIDFDSLLKLLKKEYPELKIERSEVEEYVENGYFPELYLEDGKRGFMMHTSSRIDFIKEIIDKWGYNKHEIKQIIENEDYFIDDFNTSNGLKYSSLPSLPYYIKYAKDEINENKIILKYKQSLSVKTRLKKQNKKLKKYLKYLDGKKFKDLPLVTQKSINEAVFEINQNKEMFRWMWISSLRATSLLGFSPNIGVGVSKWAPIDSDGDVNDNEHPYTYNYLERQWSFCEWEFDPKLIDSSDIFFATPEFYIGCGDDNSFNISIRDTQKVDARYLREIEKYYNSFRKCLNISKKPWGEKSGRKEMLAKRDKLLKETFKKFKKQDPSLGAYKNIEKCIDRIAQEYDEISFERAERIIYSNK